MSDEELNVDRGDEYVPTPDPVVDDKKEEIDEEEPLVAAEEAAPTPAVEEEKPKEHMLPKSRFDEAVRKERAEKEELQARLQQLEQQAQHRELATDAKESQEKLQEMIKAHGTAISDGELDKAAQIMTDMMQFQSEVNQRQFERMSANTKEQAKQEVQYDAVVARLETEYPAIDPESADFDRAAVRRIQAFMTGLLQTENITPSAALQEAVETIMPKKEAPPVADAEKAAESGMRRKEAAVSKAMEAADRQPPSTGEVGKDHDKEGGALDAAAVMKMSWDEFIKLPDDKLSSMRGDFLSN